MKILLSLLLWVLTFSSCHQSTAKAEHQNSLWKPYTQEAVLDSIKHHKPMIIDFWAEWCPNCHELDRTVFSRPDIQAKLAQLTMLRMDVTNQDDPQVQKIIQQYDIEGVPTVILFDAKGNEIPDSRVMGAVTPQEFKEALSMIKALK